MKLMKPNELIRLIKSNHPEWSPYIQRLEKLATKYPNVLVCLSVGGDDFEADGIIAPINPDGNIDESKSAPVHEGDPQPQEPFVFTPGEYTPKK